MAEYIERMSAIATACKMCNKEFPNEPCEPANCSIQQGLFKIPTADVAEVRHGNWLSQKLLGENAWDCSECKTLGSLQWKWCPICGAKMDGVTDTNVGGKMNGKDNNNA